MGVKCAAGGHGYEAAELGVPDPKELLFPPTEHSFLPDGLFCCIHCPAWILSFFGIREGCRPRAGLCPCRALRGQLKAASRSQGCKRASYSFVTGPTLMLLAETLEPETFVSTKAGGS